MTILVDGKREHVAKAGFSSSKMEWWFGIELGRLKGCGIADSELILLGAFLLGN